MDQLRTLVERVAVGPDDRVAIVSHSQGSLLTLGYLDHREKLGEDHKIQAWVALGAPFQGSSQALAALAGRMPEVVMLPVIGNPASPAIKTAFQNLTTVYTNLPQDDTPVLYDAFDCGSPCALFPESGSQTMEELRDNPPGWWTPTQETSDRADQFWDDESGVYRSYDGIDNVSNVFTTNIPTFDAFTQFTSLGYPRSPSGPFDLTHEFWIPRYRSQGDGTVRRESATELPVPHRSYFVKDALHSFIPGAPGLPELIYDLSYGNHPTFLPPNVARDPGAMANSGWTRLLFELRTMYGYFVGGAGAANVNIQSFPVAMELIDRDTGEFLAGCFSLEDEQGTAHSHTAATRDPSVGGMGGGDQLFLDLLVPDDSITKRYRLTIVPSPEFWIPTSIPTAFASGGGEAHDDSRFDIGIHLLVHNDAHQQIFPFPQYENDAWVNFESIRPSPSFPALGFSAYLDFSVFNGVIQESRLDLWYDADGDGYEDGHVTQVPASPKTSEIDGPGFAAFPYRDETHSCS